MPLTLALTLRRQLLCRSVELLVASLKMVIQARDEMAGALAESLVAAVCLPFVMPPKLAQELRKVRGDAGEMQGKCRGDAGEMQGRCRGDVGEM